MSQEREISPPKGNKSGTVDGSLGARSPSRKGLGWRGTEEGKKRVGGASSARHSKRARHLASGGGGRVRWLIQSVKFCLKFLGLERE